MFQNFFVTTVHTNIDQNQHIGLESTTCGSITARQQSEICGSSIGNSQSYSSALNLSTSCNNNNSFSPPSSSSGSPHNSDNVNQGFVPSLNNPNKLVKNRATYDVWLNEAPTHNIPTDLISADPENVAPKNPNDPFGLEKTINLNLPIINQCTANKTSYSLWGSFTHLNTPSADIHYHSWEYLSPMGNNLEW